MECKRCRISKISTEFPPLPLVKCNHPSTCLQCLLADSKGLCPICSREFLANEIEKFKFWWKSIAPFDLEDLMPPQTPVVPSQDLLNPIPAPPFFHVSIFCLDGMRRKEKVNRTDTVKDLKDLILKNLRLSLERQRLYYNQQELVEGDSKNPHTLWGHYGMKENAEVMLIVLMYPQITDLRTPLIFELGWVAPARSFVDSLDAAAICYLRNGKLYGIVDFETAEYKTKKTEGIEDRKKKINVGIEHSGHPKEKLISSEMAQKQGRPKQVASITTTLEKIPVEIDQIYFTLSSYLSDTLEEFEQVSVSLHTQKAQDLAKYDATKNSTPEKSIIMCCLRRTRQGWEIIELGLSSKKTDQKAQNYDSICKTIEKTFDQNAK